MSSEHLPIKKTIVERFHLKPAEGVMVAALLGLLRITVETKGLTSQSAALILAGFPHTSHLDTAVIAHAARKNGRKNIFPVPKGDYWDRGGYNLLLRLFFGNHFHMTKSSKDHTTKPRTTFFDTFHEKIQSNGQQHTVIIFPEGGRNRRLGKVHRGAFVASVDAVEKFNISVPVQPTEIRNMPDVLSKGDLSTKELAGLLFNSIKGVLRGKKQVVQVVFHEPISPKEMAEQLEIESKSELIGAVMSAYLDVVNQSSPTKSNI